MKSEHSKPFQKKLMAKNLLPFRGALYLDWKSVHINSGISFGHMSVVKLVSNANNVRVGALLSWPELKHIMYPWYQNFKSIPNISLSVNHSVCLYNTLITMQTIVLHTNNLITGHPRVNCMAETGETWWMKGQCRSVCSFQYHDDQTGC